MEASRPWSAQVVCSGLPLGLLLTRVSLAMHRNDPLDTTSPEQQAEMARYKYLPYTVGSGEDV